MRGFTSITLVASLAALAISSSFAATVSDQNQVRAAEQGFLTGVGLRRTITKRTAPDYNVDCYDKYDDNADCCDKCVDDNENRNDCLEFCYEEAATPEEK